MRVLFVLVYICLAAVMAGFRKTVCFGGRYCKRGVDDDTVRPNSYLETVRRDDEPCQRPYMDRYLTTVKYRNQSVGDITQFPSGAQLLVRCADIGSYVMNGSNIVTCKHGRWSSDMPTCESVKYLWLGYVFMYQGKHYYDCLSPVCVITDVGTVRVKKGATVNLYCFYDYSEASFYKNHIKLQGSILRTNGRIRYKTPNVTKAFSGSYTCKDDSEQITHVFEVVD